MRTGTRLFRLTVSGFGVDISPAKSDLLLMPPVYEPNPKHKEPWQRGRRGSLCPEQLGKPAQDLLIESVLDGNKRWATDGQRAFCAHEHSPDRWHGHPVGWREVPARVRRIWLDEGKVTQRDIKRFWEGDE